MRSLFLSTSILFALIIVSVALVSCEPAGRSASQAFDNANEVIKAGSDKLFMEPGATATPAVLE